jgi:hypothetical protein
MTMKLCGEQWLAPLLPSEKGSIGVERRGLVLTIFHIIRRAIFFSFGVLVLHAF